jgi:ubiquitin-protein ligase
LVVSETTRQQRLAADFEALAELRSASTILEFEATGQPPDRYDLTFRGRGLRRDASTGEILDVEVHEAEVRLTLSYPRHPPDIRWLTPLFHPNVSFGGFIRLDDLGLPWTEALGLDVVCERLWDVARLAHYDLDRATNYAARNWLQERQDVALPVDRRPLRDKMPPRNANVIRYRRRGDQHVELPQAERIEEILYIDETTPVPPIQLGSRRRRADGDDVLYIGDE